MLFANSLNDIESQKNLLLGNKYSKKPLGMEFKKMSTCLVSVPNDFMTLIIIVRLCRLFCD